MLTSPLGSSPFSQLVWRDPMMFVALPVRHYKLYFAKMSGFFCAVYDQPKTPIGGLHYMRHLALYVISLPCAETGKERRECSGRYFMFIPNFKA